VLGSRQAAEDVMQETFTQIWQRPNGFKPGRGTLRAYLFGAGRKRAVEWWRKHDISKKPLQNGLAECDNETASLVGDAFERLPEEQRTLMWLREVEGHSCAELAAILEVPVGTVRSRLFAAREELRRIWQAGPKTKEVDT
jgi:RNA polymerase sigma-70 factor (ECF subfamily)